MGEDQTEAEVDYYTSQRRTGKNVVLLAPDVAQAFPTDESVNDALRLVMQMAEIPSKRRTKAKARTSRRLRMPA